MEIFQGVDEDSDSSRGRDVSPKGEYTDSTGLPAAQRKRPCALQVPDVHLWSHLPSAGKSRGNSLRLILGVHFNSFCSCVFKIRFAPKVILIRTLIMNAVLFCVFFVCVFKCAFTLKF